MKIDILKKRVPFVILAAATVFFQTLFLSTAMAQTRIVIVPFYTEQGGGSHVGLDMEAHFRRTIRHINKQLDPSRFEVLNAWARNFKEMEYDRVMNRTREDSLSSCKDLCLKYGVDMAYVLWLEIRVEETVDGFCRASLRVEGEGYDSGGRDLGLGIDESRRIARRDCDDAVALLEEEAGAMVGRKLMGETGLRGENLE